MREGRVIALAGLFQALALVRAIAQRGGCDAQTAHATLASVFRIDAASVIGVYGRTSSLRLGLRTLITQLEESGSDMAVTRMAVTVMRLERTLARQGALSFERWTGLPAPLDAMRAAARG